MLFRLEVRHLYFSDPSRCRMQFEPDGETRAWLKRSGCVIRPFANGLSVYRETPMAGRPVDLPATLSLTVKPLDPEFRLYSEGQVPLERLTPGSPPQPVFDSGTARLDPTANVWRLTLGPQPARPHAGPDFIVQITVADDVDQMGRTYQIEFRPRAIIWKYLLIGDWAAHRPCVIESGQQGQGLFADPFTDLAGPPRQVQLADGRMAIPFRSTEPITLSERPTRRFQLWSRQADGAPGKVLVSGLPAAVPANLTFEKPGDPSSLVAEIYVAL